MPTLANCHGDSNAPDRIIPLSRPRSERESDGEGWLVLLPSGHGWLLGDRSQALEERIERLGRA